MGAAAELALADGTPSSPVFLSFFHAHEVVSRTYASDDMPCCLVEPKMRSIASSPKAVAVHMLRPSGESPVVGCSRMPSLSETAPHGSGSSIDQSLVARSSFHASSLKVPPVPG